MIFNCLDHVRPVKWPSRLAAPVFAGDTHFQTMAMSILVGVEFMDGDRWPPVLPVEKAKDVMRWAGYVV